ncbi:AraC family transcriptional regulator [Azotobacter armeniacus]
MFTVSVSYARLVEETLRAEGLEVNNLLKELDLSSEIFNDMAGCRVKDLSRILNRAVVQSGNPDIGLKAYGLVKPGIYDVVGYVMMSSPNLKCALEHLVRFCSLIDNGVDFSLDKEGSVYRLCSDRHGGSKHIPRQFYDISMAALLSYLRWLYGSPQFMPLCVEFMHSEPLDTMEYRRILQCPMEFDSSNYSILFDAALLDSPLSTANAALASMHERFAEQRLHEQTSQLSTWRVQQLIMERLAEGEPTVEEVAAALCVSKRTLQRCLKKEGTQYKDLLSETRREQAHLYLHHSHFSLQEVAYLLGFHEHSSFFRACSRWFGMTPGQYRAHRSLLRGESAENCAVAAYG